MKVKKLKTGKTINNAEWLVFDSYDEMYDFIYKNLNGRFLKSQMLNKDWLDEICSYLSMNCIRAAGKKLSISRQEWNPTERRYKDGITWDEIMEIKHDIGMGDKTGIEFFPADDEVINLGNVRHIWIVPDDKINDALKLK